MSGLGNDLLDMLSKAIIIWEQKEVYAQHSLR